MDDTYDVAETWTTRDAVGFLLLSIAALPLMAAAVLIQGRGRR